MAPESPDQSLSGVPPIAWLSGLNYGPGGSNFSGQTQQGSLSGTQRAGVQPGIPGGLTLDQLQQLFQLQNAEAPQGAPNTSSLLAAIGGQGLGAGSFGQTQSTLAGQGTSPVTTQSGMVAGGGSGTSVDPLSIIAKALGAAKSGVGLASNVQGQDTTAQAPDQAQAGVGTASPVASTGQVLTADQTGNIAQGTPADFAALGGTGQESEQIFSQLKAARVSDAELQALGITGPEMGANIAGPGAAIGTGTSQAGAGGLSGSLGTPSPTAGGINTSGAAAGGIQGIQGLLAAIQALTGGGSDLSKILGVGQGLGGVASGAAGLSDALNLTQGLGSAVGGFAAPAGVLAQLAQLLGGGFLGPEAENAQAQQIGLTGLTAPIAGSAAASAAAAAPAGSALAAVAPALSAIAAPLAFAGPVLGAIMAIMQALNKPGNEAINRFTGVQGPQTTQALENVMIPAGTDFSQLSTPVLEQLVGAEGNALGRYYNYNLPEDRYLTGLQAEGSPEFGQVQKALSSDQASMLQAIANLQQRGIGSDVIGNLMAPQLNNISQMNNSAWMGVPDYQSPAAMMQQYGGMGLQSNEQLAAAYGGPTWLALNQIFGPQLASTLGQYGIQGPQADFSQYMPNPQYALGNIATQYGGPTYVPTADQIASQYDPNYAPSREQIASQYGNPFAPLAGVGLATGDAAAGDAGGGIG